MTAFIISLIFGIILTILYLKGEKAINSWQLTWIPDNTTRQVFKWTCKILLIATIAAFAIIIGMVHAGISIANRK